MRLSLVVLLALCTFGCDNSPQVKTCQAEMDMLDRQGIEDSKAEQAYLKRLTAMQDSGASEQAKDDLTAKYEIAKTARDNRHEHELIGVCKEQQ